MSVEFKNRPCTKCGEQRRSEFGKQSGYHEGLRAECKACMMKRENARHAANPQKFRDRDNARHAANRQKFRDRKNACYRAGEDFAFRRAAESSPSGQEICSFPGCKVTLRFHLEFHHVDPTTKLAPVAALYVYTRKRLAAEVDKCILYCQHHHFQYHNPAPAPNPHPLFPASPAVTAQLAAL